jgi:threonine/homoserine/homoserine lactone efflux protein
LIEPAALLAWTALVVVLTLTPGPDTMLVVSHAARGGLRSGLAAVAGIQTGALWYAVLIAFGALSFLAAVPALFFAVKIAGAVYLAWLGAAMIWTAVKGKREEGAAAVDLKQPYAQGFLTNALNPKVALFYLAALPQFASGSNAPLIGVMLIGVHSVVGCVYLVAVTLAASRARRITWNARFVRWLEGSVGAFFVAVAGRLAMAQR